MEKTEVPATADQALRSLCRQIELGGYRDPHGQRLVLNTAYLDAVTLLRLQDLLGREHRSRD